MPARVPYEQLKCRVDRWVGGRAVLKFGDRQELMVAQRYLPKGIAVGDTLELRVFTEVGARQDRGQLARAILEEILAGREV